MTKQFLELTTGGRLPPNSMAKLRVRILMQKINCDVSETTAETLLRHLEEDDDMIFMSHTRSYDEASNLVKIHKKRKKSSQN